MQHKSAIVIGAGIVGLAVTRSLLERGYAVTVFERNEKAVGASIRNFGMLWPIGQPNGHMYERAQVSKSIWKQICDEAGLWYEELGSLHAAYNDLEEKVINEFVEANKNTRPVALLSAKETLKKSSEINPKKLKGALWRKNKIIIKSRVAMDRLPAFSPHKSRVPFHLNTAITSIDYPTVT